MCIIQKNSQIKIAVLVPSLINRGPVIVANNIVSGLYGDFHFELFYFDPIFEIKPKCPFYHIKSFNISYFSKFDIIHSHGFRPDLFNKKIKNKFPYVVSISTIHNFIFEDFNSIYGIIISFIFGNYWIFSLKSFNKIVVLTHLQKQFYSKYISSSKLFVIENGVHLNTNVNLSLEHKIKDFISKFDNPIILGTTCQLIKRKGLVQILRSLTYLNNYIFIVVGDGPEMNYLIREAKNNGVFDRVLFTGYYKKNYILFEYIDVFLLTSYSEGYPLSLIEATSNLIPSVCSDLPIFDEILSNDIRFTYKLNDINDLVDKIQYVYNNRYMIKINISKFLLCRMDFNLMIKKYSDLYLN
ncbi:glycosyltransferase family 4 protein [Aquirufa antheringensis]